MNKEQISFDELPSQFKEHEDYVKKVIHSFFDALKLDCELNIKFVESADENEYEITDCILKSISVKKHELLITHFTLDSLNYDRGEFFCLAVYHEFEHIKDHINMMKTKLFKFNPCLANQKSFERKCVSIGFLFWTEVYAYYNTIEFSNENNFHFEKITFGSLVKNYIKTVAHNKKLYRKHDMTHDEGIKYIKTVDSFIYLCSKYIASAYASHSRVPYAKIDKNKDYKRVYSILCGLEPKVQRLLNNPYCPKSYENLYKLGSHICRNLRWKIFKVGLIKKRGTIRSFY